MYSKTIALLEEATYTYRLDPITIANIMGTTPGTNPFAIDIQQDEYPLEEPGIEALIDHLRTLEAARSDGAPVQPLADNAQFEDVPFWAICRLQYEMEQLEGFEHPHNICENERIFDRLKKADNDLLKYLLKDSYYITDRRRRAEELIAESLATRDALLKCRGVRNK